MDDELDGLNGLGMDINPLLEELRSVKRSRDEAMTTAAEAVRKAKFWEKEARRLGWKAKL